MVNEDEDDEKIQQLVYAILFYCSISFLFIPLIVNLWQLHKQLSRWLTDPILLNTDAPVWILSNLRLLYLISIVSGGSFSAIALVNSYLLQTRIFSMGLSKCHQKLF